MKRVRLFGWNKRDREVVKDFRSIDEAVAWAKENEVEISGLLNETGLEKMKSSRAAEADEWSRFAAASFEYVRGIRK